MGLGSEIRDPEKNLFRILDPGVKKSLDPGSGSAILEIKLKELHKLSFRKPVLWGSGSGAVSRLNSDPREKK
jgi:hypothetical protein